MIAINNIAKEMTLDEFNKRFKKEIQGVRDTITDKIYFCPNDLGFKLTRLNCEQGLICKECWEYAERHLINNQVIKQKLEEILT